MPVAELFGDSFGLDIEVVSGSACPTAGRFIVCSSCPAAVSAPLPKHTAISCRVGLVRGEAAAELFVPWLERTGEPVYYADAKQLFAAVVSGEADAALITGSMAAELYPYRELEVGGVLGQLSRGGTIGTAKQELAGVIGLLDRFLQTAEGEALRSAVQEQQKLYARPILPPGQSEDGNFRTAPRHRKAPRRIA